jgi:hypothetical protein
VGAVVAALALTGTSAPASASLIGELSGTVTGGGVPLPNVWVTLTPVSESGEAAGNPKRTLTDESGRYEFPEVYDQNIKIHVRAPLLGDFVDTYFQGAFTFSQASVIPISDWPVTADVDLPVGGSVSGQVVDSQTGAPVPEAQVSAVIAATPDAGPVGVAGRTESPGTFAVSGLPPVPMELRVRLPPTSDYLKQGPGQWQEGVRIDGSIATAGVTVGLSRGAQISGTVRDDRGDPVAGAAIKVVGCLPHCPLIASSDTSGAYRITGVTPGSRLGVVAWKSDQLVRQWYPGRDNAAAATDILLEAGDELEDVDFALSRSAFMTVNVTGADSGEPLPGAIVLLVSSTDPRDRRYALRSKDRPGSMRLGPLHAGDYTLSVLPGRSNPSYGPVEDAVDRTIAPRGIITLGPEDDLEFALALPRVAGSAAPDDATGRDESSLGGTARQSAGCRSAEDAAPPPGAGAEGPESGWPGLDEGFLAASGEVAMPW